MPRPSVLVVDPETSRRKELAHGLAEFGYEVIPAINESQGMLSSSSGWRRCARASTSSSPVNTLEYLARGGRIGKAQAGPGTVGAALFQPTDDELPLVAPLSETT